MKYEKKATILIYTLVLTILGVFMAIGILNLSQRLASDYKYQNIDSFLNNAMRIKSDIILKYSRELNTTGSGFIDIIGCPKNISMSGSVNASLSIDSSLTYDSGLMYCSGTHAGDEFKVYFNTDSTDLSLFEYQNKQANVNQGNKTFTLSDSDNTYVDLTNSYSLESDGIDDNFNSDNYTIFSTGSIAYSTGYIDDDANARLSQYGYIFADSGWYNVFWSNSKMSNYIDANSNNDDGVFQKIGALSSAYLGLDIDGEFQIKVFQIDKQSHDLTGEFVIENLYESSNTLAPELGFLSGSMQLQPDKTAAFAFDFTSNDYAVFVKNETNKTILYKVFVVDSAGTQAYISPIKDDEPGLSSYLSSHIILGKNGSLIAGQEEFQSLK